MKGIKLQGNHAGYAIWDPEKCVPELRHVGEEWAFPDHKVPDHRHPHYEFHLQLTGQTMWQVKSEGCMVGSNSLIAVSPNVRHSMRATGTHAHHFIYCSIDVVSYCKRININWNEALLSKSHFLISNAEVFTEPFYILSREMRRTDRHRRLMVESATDIIVALLDRHATMEKVEPTGLGLEDIIVTKAKDYCEAHLPEKLCVDTMAKELGISRSNLFNTLKDRLGVSPFAYHSERRMVRAREMLRTEYLPLTAIALELGFGSSQHFSAAFKKRFGTSPSQCRKNL